MPAQNELIGKGKGARTKSQIRESVSLLKQALFIVMVPAYGRVKYDDVDVVSNNGEIRKAVVKLLTNDKFSKARDINAIFMSALMKEDIFNHLHRLTSDIRDAGAFDN